MLIDSFPLDEELMKKLPARVAARWRVLPLEKAPDGSVRVAAADPDDFEMLDNLGTLFGAFVIAVPAREADIEKAIHDRYGVGADAVQELADDSAVEDIASEIPDGSDGAMVRFVNDLIRRAQRAHATDIHIEPYDDELRVRFRVDGLLHDVPTPAALARFQPLLASRVKVMAEMNIAEKRLPQDGRIRFNCDEQELDIRVSTIPTIHGESIDLRLLPRTRLVLGLEQLGMSADQRDGMAALIRKPNGIVLVTGPTGHGKTTTLYACLSRINTDDKKIITIEDPVEVRLRGVNQIQVHSKIGLTFASGLRSILRQDPDVIMIGEVRDADTAEIAIRASLTGHLVFSTLHTNDAVGAITRLVDMGVEPYLVASSIHAVLAQRLIRLVCSSCRGDAMSRCESCRGTGFRGRTGIFELFIINDEIRDMIAKRASHAEIRRKARSLGMRTLFDDGQLKARAGLTRSEEVLRVTEQLS